MRYNKRDNLYIYTDASITTYRNQINNAGLGVIIANDDDEYSKFNKGLDSDDFLPYVRFEDKTSNRKSKNRYNKTKMRTDIHCAEYLALDHSLYIVSELLEEGEKHKNLNIYTDSMIVYLTLNGFFNMKAIKINRMYHRYGKIIDNIKEKLEATTENYSIMHVKAHANNWGNELADKEAKKARKTMKAID